MGTIALPENRSTTGLLTGRVEGYGPDVEHLKVGDLVVFPGYYSSSVEKLGVAVVDAKTILGILQD